MLVDWSAPFALGFRVQLPAAEPVEGSPRQRGVCAAVGDQQVVEDTVLIGEENFRRF